ncbi:MAG: hypothetical protein AAF420_01455, partial [Pseudomonadota bacterium]
MNLLGKLMAVTCAVFLASCATLKGDIDESPRTQQVDDDIFLLNFNAYDLAVGLSTINEVAQNVCEGR